MSVVLRVANVSFWCVVLDKGLKDQEGQTQASDSLGVVGAYFVSKNWRLLA